MNDEVDRSDYLLSFQRDGVMSDATWAAYSVTSKHHVMNCLMAFIYRRNDTQYNDTQHIDIQHSNN
jgi:hypothetical protein